MLYPKAKIQLKESRLFTGPNFRTNAQISAKSSFVQVPRVLHGMLRAVQHGQWTTVRRSLPFFADSVLKSYRADGALGTTSSRPKTTKDRAVA